MLVAERAKLAARGSNEDEQVLLENIEAQIIDAIACDRAEREGESRCLRLELELAKIDLEREREERKGQEFSLRADIELKQDELERTRCALSSANQLLRFYIG